MILRTLYDESLAQASYLIGCSATGEALVIDPNRHIDQYIQLAQSKDLRITAVTETHIHADFVSGARELAQNTGAQLYLSDMGPVEWKYTYAEEAGAILLHDGDIFKVGNILLQALHTPGHTPEHVSFLLTDTATADEPMGLFTGDFLFVGDVGRPDLLERAAGLTGTMEVGARMLFHSLQKIRHLPDYLQIWPGHGAGSACGRTLGAVSQSTLGYERRWNWAFSIKNEDEFVKEVLAGQPEPPFYFAEMKRINKVGPALIGTLTLPLQETLDQVKVRLMEGVRIVDTRHADEYAVGHIPGTINIPLNGSFITWAGWLLPYDRPFLLIADAAEVAQAQRSLSLIGLEHIAGYLPIDAINKWEASGNSLERIQTMDVATLRQRLQQEHIQLLDVRGASEYAAGHIEGSKNIPLGYLERHLQEILTDRTIAVHCQAGTRSAIAVSILAAHGFKQSIDILKGFAAWQKAGNPVEKNTL
ncbi:MBL fold hydrolase [Reticulibacter mediterranei]|uniref:MBL fold hydrolase n=1 Tax=Reticulibacter mediterranei TaxID=2778369 RepID=A0A8J3N2E8_9CHLR|nr:MBL fold metallo-hydrolase [Reticulibacter mediterranei]GHO93130.1 MBL fold hydrolase [Reticulibacter mediterranei]